MPTINDVMEVAELLKNKAVVVVEDHCVAVRNRNSSCCRCSQVCLAQAITVQANKIAIDDGACMACGACVAVCPTAAIVPLEPTNADIKKKLETSVQEAQGIAVIACARKASKQQANPDAYATVPCLARMEEDLLISLVAQGYQDIMCVDGTCETCKYGKLSPAIDAALDSARDLLEMIGSEALLARSSEFPSEIRLEDERKAVGAARRGFFSDTKGYAKNVALSAAEKAMDDLLQTGPKNKTIRDRLGVNRTGRMPVFEADRNMRLLDSLSQMGEPVADSLQTRIFGSVGIEKEKCSGCGMCIMFCPTAALKYSELEEPEDETMRYVEFQVADCTQCGLCYDVCLRNCVSLDGNISPEELFDFEPRLIEIPRPKQTSALFGRKNLS